MIDHLMMSYDEPSLISVIGSYNPDGRGPLYSTTQKLWRTDISHLCQVMDHSFPNNPPNPPAPLPGVFRWIGLTKQDSFLSNLTNNCKLVGDRGKAAAGDPTYLIYSAYDAEQRMVYTITPVVAGAHYPFMIR